MFSCSICKTHGEEDGVFFDGSIWICDHCYELRKEAFRDDFLMEKN